MHKILLCLAIAIGSLLQFNCRSLNTGNVIILSSGTTGGPRSWRILQKHKTMISEAKEKYPNIMKDFSPNATLFINAYPAFIPFYGGGDYIDAYVDPDTAKAALKFAFDQNKAAVLIAQPLFALELFMRYEQSGLNFPKRLLVVTGGYPIPSSLLTVLETIAEKNNCLMNWLAGYGLAEIDAGLFFSMEMKDKEIIYYPRSDVKVAIVNPDSDGFGKMKISLKNKTENELVKDEAKQMGNGFIIRAEKTKVNKKNFQILESWTLEDWRRKTGYLYHDLNKKKYIYQLREGLSPNNDQEASFYSYAESIGGFSWNKKPIWK
jgi:hypothetical protein